jgi:hypothetical protein
MNWITMQWCSDCQSRVLGSICGVTKFCECNDNEIEDEDPCICIPDEPNPMCESCF